SVGVDLDNAIKEVREDNNLEAQTVKIIKEEIAPPAPALPSAAIIGGAIATTIVVVAALLGTEVGKYSLFSLIAPLYIKRKYAVLDQFTRGRIYNYIELSPGAHYNLIKSKLDVGNGTLSYHLNILEKEGYIRSETEGMYKRFYVMGVKTFEKAVPVVSNLQKDIIDMVKAHPGITQKELITLTGKSQQAVSYNIKVLMRAGLLREERIGKEKYIYLEREWAE
ncbi:MAG: winged helix-turn-helix transcriptional regulator, partial [Candidatus Thermoplasmatota archaeon]